MDLELRLLKSFVAVAEELNFTKAARRLFIAQQALSTHIRQLEDRMGVPLVERTTRKVSLTPAGEVLHQRAVRLIAESEDLIASVRAAAGGDISLVVGFVAPVDHAGVAHALAAFEHEQPGAKLVVRYGDLLDPTGGLRDRQVDCAFVYGPFDTTGLELRLLFQEPRGVALAESHPLARFDEVSVQQLVAEPTFDFPTPDAAWRTFWEAGPHRTRPATYVAQFRSLDALVQGVRAGLGVHVATRPLVDTTGSGTGITWRPVPGLEPLDHFIAWRSGDDRSLVADFVATILAAFPEDPAGGVAPQ